VWLEKLDVSGWRNHSHSYVSCVPGTTLLIGSNGQGKTNLVEALYFLATLGSHRVSSNGVLIGDGGDSATIYAELRHDARAVSVGVTLRRKGPMDALVNGAKAKPSDLPRWVSVVMFAPEDITIVRGEPSARRSFMDHLVISSSPSMSGVYQDFDRVLKQRNSLLKSLRARRASAESSTLEVWNEKFVSLGAQIVAHRARYLREVIPLATEHYGTLAEADSVAYKYLPSFLEAGAELDYGDTNEVYTALVDAVIRRAADEIERGQTLVGPQRDDVEFTISTKPARTHASQGETWSLALSLRLATAAWLKQERSSGDPIIVLDDVFAELDARRRERLVGLVTGYQQIIVTSAVEEDVPAELAGAVFDVRNGVVAPR
jgi:DNA replication and repair protein RecF